MNKFIKVFNKILEIDYLIFNKLHKFNNNLLIKLSAHLGNIIIIFIVLILFYLFPIKNSKEISIISFVSILINTIIIFILKYTVRRKRKEDNNPLFIKFETYSFPSGHVNRIASIIIPFCYIPILSLFFLILSIIIGFSRMVKGYHYLSDCVVGFLIGIIVGYIIKLLSYLYLDYILRLIDIIISF